MDAALLVIEAGRWDDGDALAYDALREAKVPVVLVVNQVDRLSKKLLLPFLAEVSQDRDFASVHPVSALKRSRLEPLVEKRAEAAAEQPRFTRGRDHRQSQRFLAGELVRAKR